MHFLAQNWVYFLLAAVVFAALAIYNQVQRIRRMMETGSNALIGGEMDFRSIQRSVMDGVGLLVAFYLSAVLCGILFLVGIIASFLGK
jgi:hypothetical protein